jgi:hypothetical protein
MVATAVGLLIVWAGIEILDLLDITRGAAASVAPILAVPIVILLAVGIRRYIQRYHLRHLHAHR